MHSFQAQSNDVLSFFSGAGGFSYGFALSGLKPVCGAEVDKDAFETYERNVGSDCHNVDLSSIDPGYFRRISGGISSRSNKKLIAFKREVGPQSYSES